MDNPKHRKIKARIDKKSHEIRNYYYKKTGKSKVERLQEKIKNQNLTS